MLSSHFLKFVFSGPWSFRPKSRHDIKKIHKLGASPQLEYWNIGHQKRMMVWFLILIRAILNKNRSHSAKRGSSVFQHSSIPSFQAICSRHSQFSLTWPRGPGFRFWINIDNKARFCYRGGHWFRLIDASICYAAAEAGTQFTIFLWYAPKKQCPILKTWRASRRGVAYVEKYRWNSCASFGLVGGESILPLGRSVDAARTSRSPDCNGFCWHRLWGRLSMKRPPNRANFPKKHQFLRILSTKGPVLTILAAPRPPSTESVTQRRSLWSHASDPSRS